MTTLIDALWRVRFEILLCGPAWFAIDTDWRTEFISSNAFAKRSSTSRYRWRQPRTSRTRLHYSRAPRWPLFSETIISRRGRFSTPVFPLFSRLTQSAVAGRALSELSLFVISFLALEWFSWTCTVWFYRARRGGLLKREFGKYDIESSTLRLERIRLSWKLGFRSSMVNRILVWKIS